MDFSITELQEILKKSARDFLNQECPASRVKEIIKDDKGYSPVLWEKLRDLGWLGLAFPQKYGGVDGSFLDLVVLCEEMGYACFPSPYLSSIVLSGLTVLDSGTEEQKQEFLPGLADGKIICTFALTEASAQYTSSAIQLVATPNERGFILNGTKLFVPFAHIADYMLCAARTSAASNGVALFIVESKKQGIHSSLLKTMGHEKICEVVFSNVDVDKNSIVGVVDGGGWLIIQKALQRAAVAKCAEMAGGAQRVLEMATVYAKERVQFGRPIGSFQAIQHQCADMAMDIKASNLLTYEAAWRISENMTAAKEVAMAKAWVSEAYVRVTYFGAKIHGAIGLTADHDMPLYFKQAKVSEPVFGNGDFHREVVAAELGL